MMISEKTAVLKLHKLLTDVTSLRGGTCYINPKKVVRLTRQRRHSKRAMYETFVLTVGAPNYRERAFIKSCKKVGKPFPVKKLQYRLWPKK
jgi:hypothetical protein